MTKQTGAVTDLLGRLLPLWTQPAGSRDDAEAAFREVYADPVVVNGTEMPVAELVGRARALQQAFDGLEMQVLDTVEAPGRFVVAFLMRGRHIGPFRSPLGPCRVNCTLPVTRAGSVSGLAFGPSFTSTAPEVSLRISVASTNGWSGRLAHCTVTLSPGRAVNTRAVDWRGET